MGDDVPEEPTTRRLLSPTFSDTDPSEGTDSHAHTLTVRGLKRTPSDAESKRKPSGDGGELKRTSSGGESVPWVGELIRNERTRRLAARISKNSGIFTEDIDSDDSPPTPRVLPPIQRLEWQSITTQELKEAPPNPTSSTDPSSLKPVFRSAINEQPARNGNEIENETSENTDSIGTSSPTMSENKTLPPGSTLESTGARERGGDATVTLIVESETWDDLESTRRRKSTTAGLETIDEDGAISLVDGYQSHQTGDTMVTTGIQSHGVNANAGGAIGNPPGTHIDGEDWDVLFGVKGDIQPKIHFPGDNGSLDMQDRTTLPHHDTPITDSHEKPSQPNTGMENGTRADLIEDDEDWDEEFGIEPGSHTPKLLGIGSRASPEPDYNASETLNEPRINQINYASLCAETVSNPPQTPNPEPYHSSDDEDWDTEFGIEKTENPQIHPAADEMSEREDWDEEFEVSKTENLLVLGENSIGTPQAAPPSNPPPKQLGLEEGEDDNWDDDFEGGVGKSKPPPNIPTQPTTASANHTPSSRTVKGSNGPFSQIDVSQYQDGDDDDFEDSFQTGASPLVLRRASGVEANSGARIQSNERGGKNAEMGNSDVHGSALRTGRSVRPKMTVNFSTHRQVVAAPEVCGWEEYWEHSSSDDESPPPASPTKTQQRPSSAPTSGGKTPRQAPKGPLQIGKGHPSPSTVRSSKTQPPESPTRLAAQPPSPKVPEPDGAISELTPEEAELAKRLGYTESKGKTSTWSKSKRTVSLTVKNIFRKKTQ